MKTGTKERLFEMMERVGGMKVLNEERGFASDEIYDEHGDGSSEGQMLNNIAKKSEQTYNNLLSKVNKSFNTKEELKKFLESFLNNKTKLGVFYFLVKEVDNDLKSKLNMNGDFYTIYELFKKENYYRIKPYEIVENYDSNDNEYISYSDSVSTGTDNPYEIINSIT